MTTILSSLIMVMTVFTHPFAPSEGLVNRLEKEHRQEICLNGHWQFQAMPVPDGWEYGKGNPPELAMPSPEGWDNTLIRIPSPWNANSFAKHNLEGPDHRDFPSYPQSWDNVRMAWMRKTVTVPQDWSGQRLILHFEAVAGFAEVYVNGRKVAENFDNFLPFEADITDELVPGKESEILVGVRSLSLFDDNSTIGRRVIPAGSMWGTHISGIWQDVYLMALPQVRVADAFVKPLVSKKTLEVEVTLRNDSRKDVKVSVGGDVKEWINMAAKDVIGAPVPEWKLGQQAMTVAPVLVTVPAGGESVVTLSAPVEDGTLDFWSPEHPSLYALLLNVKSGKKEIDLKYERFGWREWTLVGEKQCLNGKPYPLRGDSWHFMGIPQMTRRYAWAWYTAIKDMNANAVRLHAQVYPRFYMDLADEMGICVLDETANWASDGGPKLDSDKFWEASKEHLRRFVLRDRNHPGVFGWSISNENKPVILYVHKRPELMPGQVQAWKDWKEIVMKTDPTRPWISSDGEDDGEGILPVTVGHYGDASSLEHWKSIGKPWGIGEHSMAYYGTPKEVSKYNGARAFESAEGRMEGLANECWHLLADQRRAGASYSTVFNMAWYALKPLSLGKKDLTTVPSLEEDGIFFGEYVEGVPGVQPERLGPYSTTFNPGYDPALPLYEPWPLFDAMRAANAPDGPAWSPWENVIKIEGTETSPADEYERVLFVGRPDSDLRKTLDAQGVRFSESTAKKSAKKPVRTIVIVDASEAQNFTPENGADVWLCGLTPDFGQLDCVETVPFRRSSYIPENRLWTRGMTAKDFYFCESQNFDASVWSLSGKAVDEGEVLLRACRADWRKWNRRAEDMKTAALLRSEREAPKADAVFVKYGNLYISTLKDFASSPEGFAALSKMLDNAGIPREGSTVSKEGRFNEGELPGLLTKPVK